MKAEAQTEDGVYEVDLDAEEIVGFEPGASLPPAAPAEVSLPLLVTAASSGSTVVAVLDRKPPLAVSHDAGATWRESGAGLPRGTAVAVSDEDPDLVLYAARNRLYVSEDGGRFWRALALELPQILAVRVLSP